MSVVYQLDEALVQRLREAIGPIAADVDRESQLQLVLNHLADMRELQLVLRARVRQITSEGGGA